MKKLSKEQMKVVLGGSGGDSCIGEYGYQCSTSGNGGTGSQCCPGFTCKMNGTDTGTICMVGGSNET